MRTIAMLVVSLVFAVPAWAQVPLVQFEGGIGVHPVVGVAGKQHPVFGTFPGVNRNDVRGVPPGGVPWVIRALTVMVERDGHIVADGRGLLLAGGNNIGGNGGQSVRAVLFCGSDAFSSGLVALDANGNFMIDDVLKEGIGGTVMATLPDPCNSPVLLIVSGGGRWFAAGIPMR